MLRIVYFGISRETVMTGGSGETRPVESPQRGASGVPGVEVRG